jgi:hypothetical protein
MSLNEKDQRLHPSDVESVKGLALNVAEVDRPYALKCELGMLLGPYLSAEKLIPGAFVVNKCLQEEYVTVYVNVRMFIKTTSPG